MKIIGLIVLIIGSIFIGFDYGRMLIKNRRLQVEFGDDSAPYTPIRNIMIMDNYCPYLMELATLCIKAHGDADIKITKYDSSQENNGVVKVYFDNDDELLVYQYGKAKIKELTSREKKNYANKIFLDYKLPEGAICAAIEQLGLLDYMVNIGICRDKKEK